MTEMTNLFRDKQYSELLEHTPIHCEVPIEPQR